MHLSIDILIDCCDLFTQILPRSITCYLGDSDKIREDMSKTVHTITAHNKVRIAFLLRCTNTHTHAHTHTHTPTHISPGRFYAHTPASWTGPQTSNEEGRKHDLWHGQIRLIITLRLRQNGRQFADDIFKCIFLNENVLISAKISLKFVPNGPINNIPVPALVRIMAWRQPGDTPLSEPMMVSLLTHICVTRPQ